jgi:hypothetical protein
MNNPRENRQSWQEYEQKRQDYILDLWAFAYEEGESNEFIEELLSWSGARYDDGVNHSEVEYEYEEFLNRQEYGYDDE